MDYIILRDFLFVVVYTTDYFSVNRVQYSPSFSVFDLQGFAS